MPIHLTTGARVNFTKLESLARAGKPIAGGFQKGSLNQVNGLDLNGAYGSTVVSSGLPPAC